MRPATRGNAAQRDQVRSEYGRAILRCRSLCRRCGRVALIGLPIDLAHRPGVVVNFERLAQMAALVMEFPLPDEAEPAPVFRP
jgi:hypothetical protein